MATFFRNHSVHHNQRIGDTHRHCRKDNISKIKDDLHTENDSIYQVKDDLTKRSQKIMVMLKIMAIIMIITKKHYLLLKMINLIVYCFNIAAF